MSVIWHRSSFSPEIQPAHACCTWHLAANDTRCREVETPAAPWHSLHTLRPSMNSSRAPKVVFRPTLLWTTATVVVPGPSCEQRAHLMPLHNAEGGSDQLHKPVIGSCSHWGLTMNLCLLWFGILGPARGGRRDLHCHHNHRHQQQLQPSSSEGSEGARQRRRTTS